MVTGCGDNLNVCVSLVMNEKEFLQINQGVVWSEYI
jgi:hypothetical protein